MASKRLDSSRSKISFSESAREAEATDLDGPRTTRQPTASRRIPKKKDPELDPEQAALYAKQQKAALAAAQLEAKSKKGAAKSGVNRAAVAIVAGIALGAGGVGAYYLHHTRNAPTAANPPANTAPATTTSAAAPPERSNGDLPPLPTWITGRLTVEPASAVVIIDGQPIGAQGAVTLKGEEGHSFSVVIEADGKTKRFDVMLTDAGALPETVSLDDDVEDDVEEDDTTDTTAPEAPPPTAPVPRVVQPGPKIPVAPPPPPAPPPPTPPEEDIYE